MTNDEGRQVIIARLIARAWREPAFRTALLANPGQIMAEAGIDVPPGIQVVAVENTETTQYVVLPLRPDWLTDADLSRLNLLIIILTAFHLIPVTRPPGRGHGGHGHGRRQLAGAKKSAAKKSAAKKATAKKSAAKKSGRKLRGN